MAYLVDPALGGGGTQNLILSKDGAGRLYYRLGLRYAPTDLNLNRSIWASPCSGSIEAVDDPADVRRDPDGTWHIKAGARVRVHLTMVATDRRYHVALTDPLLPAWRSSTRPWPFGQHPAGPQQRQRQIRLVWWAPGTNTRICATNGPRPSPPSCGTASTSTATSPRHHPRPVHRSTQQSRRNVLSRSLRPQRRDVVIIE